MPAGEGDLYFVSVRSKERAKAAIHRFGGSRGTTDVVNGALVLAYENYGLAFVVRDDALLVLHRPAGELQEQTTRLAALSAKDSLLQLAELRRALGPRGLRGEAALVVSGAPESFVSEYLAHVEALEQTPVNAWFQRQYELDERLRKAREQLDRQVERVRASMRRRP